MYTIYHDLRIEASPKAVFEAISSPSHLVNWWPQKCTGDPVLAAEYNFYFAPEYDWYGTIITCIEYQSFHVKMTQADQDWDPTSFGFDLQPKEEGVGLQFWHQGWPECNQHFRVASFCWAMLLNGLKNYLEKGIIVPFEERS